MRAVRADPHAEVARGEALGCMRGRIERAADDALDDRDEQRREREHERAADRREAVARRAHVGHHFVVDRDAADEPLPLRNRHERHELRARAVVAGGGVGRRVGQLAFPRGEHLRVGRGRVVGALARARRMDEQGAARGAVRCVEHEVVAVLADLQLANAVFDEPHFRADVDADEQRADDRAARVGDRFVLGDVTLAEQRRETGVGPAGDERRVRGALAVEQRADRAAAVLLLQRGRHADEIVAAAREDRRDRAALLQELVGNREVEVQRLAARGERGRRGARDVDRARGVERVAGRQEAREERHRAARLGGERFVEKRDHCGDRAILLVDARVDLIGDLAGGRVGQRPDERGEEQGEERAR
ncbi:methyl-accepting chemotaxis domain protein [Burkholderia mallei]|nr:methyl-accepting chemotaxis domain protein [Burkholderia mallei]